MAGPRMFGLGIHYLLWFPFPYFNVIFPQVLISQFLIPCIVSEVINLWIYCYLPRSGVIYIHGFAEMATDCQTLLL